MSILEEDGFVLVSKDGLIAEDDDAVSLSSSRSSLFLVEDPSVDRVLLHGEEEEHPAPEQQPVVENLKPVAAEEAPRAKEAPAEVPEEQQQEAVPKQQPKYVCSGCSCDVAACADLVWEGYMGANKAAFLFNNALNIEAAAEPRKQQLSTGLFLLQDVRCRTCSVPLGWKYLKAWSQEQKYKEGTTIVQQSLVHLAADEATKGSTLSLLEC